MAGKGAGKDAGNASHGARHGAEPPHGFPVPDTDPGSN